VIRGYFLAAGTARRPYVNALVEFPRHRRRVSVAFLIDTGADRTVLAPSDLARAGIVSIGQPLGPPSTGVGGTVTTRNIECLVTLGNVTVEVTLLAFEPTDADSASTSPQPAIPSLLGHDLLSRFALLVDPQRDRVLLLEPHEANALSLP